jgi:hypothetical protein
MTSAMYMELSLALHSDGVIRVGEHDDPGHRRDEW